MRTDISFRTDDGLTLRGWHYLPDDISGKAPVVIMVHGFAGVKEMCLDHFAAVFCAAGLGVLIFDHRNFGDSDGAIRQEIDPWRQVDDIRDAITFAGTLPHADDQAIGLWGSSFAGGHVFFLGATDRRLKCLVAQVPFTGGAAMVKDPIRTDLLATQIQPMFAADRNARLAGRPPGMIGVVSEDPAEPVALSTSDSWSSMQAMTVNAPNFRNTVTIRSMELASAYEPAAYIPMIAPTPLLMVVGATDYLTPTRHQLAAYETAREPKRLIMIDGGHFAPYLSHLDEASGAARDWFVQHLASKR